MKIGDKVWKMFYHENNELKPKEFEILDIDDTDVFIDLYNDGDKLPYPKECVFLSKEDCIK